VDDDDNDDDDDKRSFTLAPVSTGMADRVRVRLPTAALHFGM